MLFLTLKIGETIELELPTGERVQVKGLKLYRDRNHPQIPRVQLGFTAPRHVPIFRSEVLDRVPPPGGAAAS